MAHPSHLADRLSALGLSAGFGSLFVGRMMLYPVSLVPGSFLDRLGIRSADWEVGHLLMVLGVILFVPGFWGLARRTMRPSPWLTGTAVLLVSVGGMLTIGQYALDFAMLAAARIDPRSAGDEFIRQLRDQPIVDWAFYRLPDLAQLGLILFTVVIWRQGSGWRIPALGLSVAAITSLAGPPLIGAWGVRAALALWFVGFSLVADAMCRRNET